jgi:hypothetical protein
MPKKKPGVTACAHIKKRSTNIAGLIRGFAMLANIFLFAEFVCSAVLFLYLWLHIVSYLWPFLKRESTASSDKTIRKKLGKLSKPILWCVVVFILLLPWTITELNRIGGSNYVADTQNSQKVAEQFLESLHKQKYSHAYLLPSPNAKNLYSAATLRQNWQSFHAVRRVTGWGLYSSSPFKRGNPKSVRLSS